MISIRPVFFVLGWLLFVCGALMGIPLLIDLANSEDSWVCFLSGMITTIFSGGFLIAATKTANHQAIHPKELVLTVCAFWLILPLFAALPLLYSSLPYNFFDCYLDTVSAMTTTGATIIYSFDSVSHGTMIWKALIELIGACVYIISSYYIIKIVYVQGETQVSGESSILYLPPTTNVAILQKSTRIAFLLFSTIIICSFLISIVCDTSLYKSFFTAASIVSTTGVPYYELVSLDNILYVLFPFMLISGLPLGSILNSRKSLASHKLQIKMYFILFLTIFIFNILFRDSTVPLIESLASSASAISTNNVFIESNTPFMFSFIGGCAGSPSGGIKIIRLIIILLALQKTLNENIYSDTKIVMKTPKITCDRGIMRAVLAYFALLIVMTASISVALCTTDISFANAFFYACSAITNSSLLSSSGSASPLDIIAMSSSTKMIISTAMILGRLELFAPFVIISSRFWKR